METFATDMRQAVRALASKPGFLCAAVFALALGVASNTVVFSAVNSVLVRPVALRQFRDPDRLVMVWERNPQLTIFFAERMPPRLRSFRQWKQQSQSFEDLAIWSDTSGTLTENADRAQSKPERIEIGKASANFFPLLGVSLALGRNFAQEEMQPGKGQSVILTDELYRSRFSRDPDILRKSLTIDGKPYQIVGVLQRGFRLPAFWEGAERKDPKVWLPIRLGQSEADENMFANFVFGRLRPGVRIDSAQSEMRVIAERMKKADPEHYTSFSANVFSLDQENAGPDLRRALLVLQVAVAFVLLIACANVGNLLLTRALEREHEIAVRAALGASQWRILRQVLAETIVITAIAIAIALTLSNWGVLLLSRTAPEDVHGLKDIQIDATVLVFTVAISAAASLLFALVPAVHILRQNPAQMLSRGSRNVSGGGSARLRNGLAAIELALSLVLLVGAGLMIRTLTTLLTTDMGFQLDHLLVMGIELPEQRYKASSAVASFNARLLENVRALPGVQSVALTDALAMKSVKQSSFEFPGVQYPPGTAPVSTWARTSDGYFETLGMRLIKGRTFSRQEIAGADPTVALINDAFASSFYKNQDAIGKSISFDNESGKKRAFTIVGVVGSERQLGPESAQTPEFYLPGNQLRSFYIVTRTVGDPLNLAPQIKQQVWNLDKDQPIADVVTADRMLHEWVAPRRFNMIVMLSFAAIALLLAAVGLYAVLAYSVTVRTREIGIRVALGAEPAGIARLVLKQGLAVAAIGLVGGMAGALALTRFMQSAIYGVGPNDPITLTTVSVVLVIIAAGASYLPAYRAARVNPVEALRAE